MRPFAFSSKRNNHKALKGTISNYCLFLFVFLGLSFLVFSSLFFLFLIRPNAAPFWSAARGGSSPPLPRRYASAYVQEKTQET